MYAIARGTTALAARVTQVQEVRRITDRVVLPIAALAALAATAPGDPNTQGLAVPPIAAQGAEI